MKNYLLVRWKKRWFVVPASAIAGTFWILMSKASHDAIKASSIIIALVCFAVVVIIFPFHWGGEDWDGD